MSQTRTQRNLGIFSAALALCLLLLLVVPSLAQAEEVRVLLSSQTGNSLTLSIDSGEYALLQGPRGAWIADCYAGDRLEVRSESGGFAVYVNGRLQEDRLSGLTVSALGDDSIFHLGGTLYRGDLNLLLNGSVLYAVNHLDIEYYLYGVVGKEIGHNQPLEAVKAQAVASRSYALASLKPNNQYYDVTNTTASQVYGGYTAEREAANGVVVQAVDATRGEVICYKNNVFEGFYHSNAGGHTEDIANVWNSTAPLMGVESPYDSYAERSNASAYRWTVELTAAQLAELARTYNNGVSIGSFVELKVSTTGADGKPSASGRAVEVTIVGSSGQVTASKDDIRSLLGGLRSTLFTVESLSGDSAVYIGVYGQESVEMSDQTKTYVLPASQSQATPLGEGELYVAGADGVVPLGGISTGVLLNGRGYGHGVGMSQWGAIGMAADGISHTEILRHYFNVNSNSDFSLQIW